MEYTNSWYLWNGTLEEFILGMLELGKPLEISLVGVFDKDLNGRGSRRDIDLPMHRDGEYSAELAKVQGGMYIEKKNIDIVGLYCIRDGEEKCVTLIDDNEIELKAGQAVIFNNKNVLHGRKGQVGSRLLLRMWIQSNETSTKTS